MLLRPKGLVLLTLLSVVLSIKLSTPAGADTGKYTITPSLDLNQVYDDNIFSRATNRKGDFIFRATPAIQAGYQSLPFTLLGRYSFDSEVYASHTELNSTRIRENASAQLGYQPIQPLSLSFSGNYIKTQTPRDINLLTTGVEANRSQAQSFSFLPSVTYQLSPLMEASGSYSFTQDKQEGKTSTDTHTTNANLNRKLTPRDTVGIGYSYRHFRFSDNGDGNAADNGTVTSHVASLSYTRELTPLTTVTLRGGPRFSEGSVKPDVTASINHTFKNGRLAFNYGRSQTTSIGLGGTVDTESFNLLLTYQPLRDLDLSVSPALFRNSQTGNDADVYSLQLTAHYRMLKWLTLAGSYQFSLQQGTLNSASVSKDQDILHNILFLTLVGNYEYKLD